MGKYIVRQWKTIKLQVHLYFLTKSINGPRHYTVGNHQYILKDRMILQVSR